MQCRFCLETDDEPMISPCNCTGSVRYIHTSCLHKWIREDEYIVEERLICTICKAPLFDLEPIPQRHSATYAPLFNATSIAVAFHYLFLMTGIHSTTHPFYHFRRSQILIYAIYVILFATHIRTKHLKLYIDIAIRRNAHTFLVLQAYCLYCFLVEESVLMALVSDMTILIQWNTHVQTLQGINEHLLKN